MLMLDSPWNHRIPLTVSHPGLDDGTSPAGVDDADGDVQSLGEAGSEEIAHRGETRACGGVALLPFASGIILRLGSTGLVHGHVPQTFVLAGHGDLIQRALHPARKGHFHVALAGAEPYFADEDVRGTDRLASAGGPDGLGLEGRSRGLEQYLPMSFGICPGADGGLEP